MVAPIARAPRPWYSRAAGALSYYARAALEKLPSLRKAPAGLLSAAGGFFASFRATRPGNAESDLAALGTSPAVYSAVMLRAYSMANYPIVILERMEDGSENPVTEPWAADMLRILETPDPADLGAIFPQMPGEQLVAQIIADLLLPGDAYLVPTLSPKGTIIGLSRLHPRSVSAEVRHGEDGWLYLSPYGDREWYPRRAVMHATSLSYQANAQGVFGVGAAGPLKHLVAAEATALEQTATMIEQGGADIVISGKSPAMMTWLKNPENRKSLEADMSIALAGKGGRRAFVIGGDLEMNDAGLKPSDLRAPELMGAVRPAAQSALGATPIALGEAGGSNFATAAISMRVQFWHDEILASRLEACWLRPMAQHFAKQSGGRSAARASRYTARIDLSTHPGMAYIRTDAIDRMEKMTKMGWTADQAAGIEQMAWPKPEGTPAPSAPANAPGASGQPRPLGDAPAGGPGRTLGNLFRATSNGKEIWLKELERRRARSERRLLPPVTNLLVSERDGYRERIRAELEQAVQRTTRAGGYRYGPIDMSRILGDLNETISRWVEGLRADWTFAFDTAAMSALDGTGYAAEVPQPTITAADYAWLESSAAAIADYNRTRVTQLVTQGKNLGLPPSDIADTLMQDQAFSRSRALLITRTEAVRADSVGTLSRYSAAEARGLVVEQEWMSDPMAAQWDRHHETLDGILKRPGESWTFASGISATGPGLSGDPGEDCNCGCGVRPKVIRKKPA